MLTATQSASAMHNGVFLDEDFRIEVDPSGTVLALPTGVWSVETVARYERAYQALFDRHRPFGTTFRLLVDLRERSAHSQEVALLLQAAFTRIAPRFERVAIVLPRSTIMAMQAKRVAGASTSDDTHQRHFAPDEIASAHIWLERNRQAIELGRTA